MHTQDFILGGTAAKAGPIDTNFPTAVKYSDKLHAPNGFNVFFDLDEGVEYAKKVNKPIMLDFTGWSCVNCRKMEDNVWIDPEVGDLIRNKYVLIQLYVDERSIEMPESKVHYSKYLKGNTTDLGKWNQDLQATRYGANSQPYYVLTDHNLNELVKPVGAILNDNKAYIAFLQSGLDKFNPSK